MSATSKGDAVAAHTEVLEFELGDETYCLDIEYVAEIVEREAGTTIPNAPPHVEGVMDLRGETTTIVDPKRVLNVRGEGGERVIVLDSDRLGRNGAVGWLVDEVEQVIPVDRSDLDAEPVEDVDAIEGMLKRDGEFVLWLDPTEIES
jgi:purine-binding chemotaxis protein CheW